MVEELYALKRPNTYPSKFFVILIVLFTFFSTFYLNNEVYGQNLTISKLGSVSADPGDIISYTIYYTNTGLSEATEVEITDYLPDLTSYTYVSSFPVGIYDAVTNTLSWTKNEIAALASLGAESGEITIQLRAGKQAINTYYYISSSPVTAENYASIKSFEESAEVYSQTVSTEIDQYCALTFSPLGEGEVKSNGNSTVRYLVNVINQGNIYDKFTIDTLQYGHPQEDILLEISLYDLSGNPLYETDWLAPGDAFYFYVDIFLDDPAAANNFNYLDLIGTSSICPSTTESTTLETKIHNPAPNKALLLLSKLDNTDPVRAGDTLSYVIYIYNYSGYDTEGLIVTETYDPNVTFLSATPSPTTGDNIWELPPLVGGDFTTIEVNVIVDMDVPNGTYLTNYVLADAINAEEAEDTSTTTLVESYPDLDIQKTGLPNPALPNDIITYTITYANLGNLTADTVVITDDYDENYLSITNPNGAVDNGNTLVFSLPDLAPGASGSLSYEAQINSKASFPGGTTLVNNTAQILTSTTEINFNNNEDTEMISVMLLPDLVITLTASSEPTPVNQAITYTITITNIGNYRSENLLIENILPAGLTFVSASDGGTLNAGTITWPLVPTMHVVDVLTRTFIATPDCSAVPSVTNTATVSNDLLETDYTNNSASLISTIESNLLIVDCPADQNVPMDAGICGAVINFIAPTAEDDCDGAVPVVRTDGSGLNSGDVFPEGITTISYSATNSNGETVSCSLDITVGPDTEAPIILNVPDDVTLECSDCIQAFENNDFEDPVIGGSWASIDASSISGWSTTAADNRIEIQKSGMIEGVVSYSGNQHAELNGNNVGDFYQEFCTVPTTTVQISFAHHKRMSASNTSDDIMEIFTGPNLGSLTSLGTFTATSSSGWAVHTIDFPIPAGQTSTVFVFRAIQGAPSNTTLGNLIDDINVITLFDATNVPYATDNCGVESLSLSEVKTDGSCTNDYRIDRTWTAVDLAGNTSIATQTVIVGDVIGPDFTLPADITISCTEDTSDTTLTGNISNLTDNCDPSPSDISYSDITTAGSCPNNYTIARTWTLIDHCSNSTSKIQVITVEDIIVPQFVEALPSDQTVDCSTSVAAEVLTATDNCGSATVTYTETINLGACTGTYTSVRTWTAVDECGNTTIHTQTIQFEDNTAPVWTTVDGDLDRTVECSSPTDFDDAMALIPVATDDCGIITIDEQPEVVGVCVGGYTVTRKWLATDDCGNVSAVFTQIITVDDSTAPNITTSASDATVECDGAGNITERDNWLSANGGAAATDNCSTITWSNDFGALSDLCGETGAVTVTFTATDNCGNFASTTATFTIEDTTAPDITTIASDLTVECDGAGNTTELNNWLSANAGAAASDICGTTIVWTNDYTSLSDDCGETGNALVTFTATDECGNTSTTSATFTIEDTTSPSITTITSDATVECDGAGNTTELNNWLNANGGASASDICGVTISWSNDYTSLSDDCGETGNALITFTATDECGNTNTTSATFTIEDTTVPIWTTLAGDLDRTAECSSPTDFDDAMALIPISTDDCGIITIVEQPELVGACLGSYTVTRKWIATDDCGNSSVEYTQIITVEDTTPPNITTLASDATVECDGAGNTTELNNWLDNNGGAIAIDNCADVSWSNNAGALSDLCAETGALTVTFTATDNCGNAATTSATFTIEDTTAPNITTAASDATVECDGAGNSTERDNWLNANAGAAASDDCGGSIVWTNDFANLSDDCGETGNTLVTFTATDECGNTASTSATFTIEDTTAPNITTAASNTTVECDGSGNIAEFNDWTNDHAFADASDICGATISWSNSINSETVTCGDAKEILVDFMATDECGNQAITQATFIIEDNTAPVWTTLAGNLDRTVECSSPTDFDNAVALAPVATDDCGNITVSLESEDISVCVGSYTVTRKWIATDDCGNSSLEYTQIITVEDTTAPNITTTASDATVECDGAGNITELNNWLNTFGGAEATDNCSIVDWTNDFGSLSDLCGETGAVTVTFTATDNCGNFTSTSATFTIEDTTAPEITTTAGDATVECDGSGNITERNNWLNANGGASASDICGTTIVWTNDFTALSDDCGETGNTLVTFTATDDCGNTTNTSATFTIEDTTAPEITTAASNTTVECDGAGNIAEYNAWISANAGAAASDICGISISWSNAINTETATCGDAKEILVDFMATDECGNTTTTSATFIIEDNTAPVWTTLAGDLDRTVECSSPTDFDNAMALIPIATDDCGTITIVEQPETVSLCIGTYTVTRKWIATDDCGNSSVEYTQIITVEDTTAPNITTLASDATVECDGAGNTTELNNWLDTFGGAEASDNCSIVDWTNDFGSLSDLCGETGAVTVTFTATDNCGNFTSTSATFTIEDTTAPEITTTAGDATVECDGSGNITERNNWLNANGGASASDICGTTIVWTNDFTALSDDCGETGNTLVTFIATDECGNTATTTATFTIEDTTAPEVTTTASDITVECDGTGNIAEYNAWLSANAGAAASDICGITISWSNAINTETATCGDAKEILVDFMATDECGNQAITQAIFIIEDNTAPVWTTLAGDLDRTVECSSPTDYDNAMALAPVATDDCGNITVSLESEDISACIGSYTVTRKWIATDDCGNSSLEYTQIITVEDTTAPDITTLASDATVECDGAGNTTELNNWLDTFGGAEASDNCSIVDWTNDYGSLSDLCGETGAVTVTFTATDNCGNFASTSATFTIEDTTAPEITTTASDATVECDGSGNITELNDWLGANGGASSSDVCGVNIVWTNDFSALSDDCGETGNALVTFTATDECGNTNTTSATFTIEDTTSPEITTTASDATVECDGSGNTTELNDWLSANGGASSSDVCGVNIVWTNDYTSLSDDCGETGNALVTFTATDECGNTATTSATFTIEDTTSPEITTTASDATVECDGAGNTTELDNWLNANAGATASDICGVTISWTNDYANLSDDCGETGNALVTFTATDECGNTSTTSATFTIEDTTAPDITTEASDASVECDGAGNSTELDEWLNTNGGAIVSETCDNNPVWTNDYASLSDECAETGNVTVTFTVTDACGNYDTTSASFTITDSTAPSFSVEASNLNVECDGAGNITELNDWLNSNGGATASDICGTAIVWDNDFANLSDECGETGNVLVTFSATDECGNTAITSATFTIEDTTAPSWDTETLSLDRNLDCTDTDGFTAASALSPTASDLCGTYTISLILDEITESSCPSSYTSQKTWGLIDECGNAAKNFIQTIIVSDNTAPLTEDLTDVHLSCEDSEGLSSALLLNPSFSDDCTPQMLIQVELIADETTYECLNTYVRIRQWQGSDLCGNSSISQQRIYVEDITPPTADPLPDLFFLCKSDIPDPDPEIIQNTDDNCSSTILREFSSDVSNNQTCPETITRNYRITDDCGNESYLSQIIVVHDTVPPTADQPETLTFVQLSDVPDPSILVIQNTWDNCTENPYVSIVSSTFDDISSPPYFIHEYKVEDECRNQIRVMHQLIVNDFPVAEDDSYTIDENSKNNIFRILENDFFGYDGPGNPSLFINSSPFHGELKIHDNGTPNNFLDDFFVYSPNRNTYEDDSFEYGIADEDGEEANAFVKIFITPNPLHIPEAFSPNGDGINEVFHIRGLFYYPDNSIIIYDEKGDKIFESDPYDNDWDGTNHFSINPFEILPQATYFYILNLGKGSKPIKGYVYINRLN